MIAALLLLSALAEPAADAVQWQTDFDKATELARTQKKRVFAYIYDRS